MNTIATVCARAGSKGVPGKNLRLMLGKPLISYTLEHALACDSVSEVFVSTDSPGIADIASSMGARVLGLRPPELATDTAAKVPVIQHLVSQIEAQGIAVDRVVDLDATSPLRSLGDIYSAISLLDDQTDLVITGYRSDKNPYFNMVEARPDGTYGLVKPPPHPTFSRQTAPPVFAMNGSIYCWRRDALSLGLWSGRVRLHEMPHERSVDIDSPLDWRLVELLLRERLEER